MTETTPQQRAEVRLTEDELNALEGAVLSRVISVQQVVEAIVSTRLAAVESERDNARRVATLYQRHDKRLRAGIEALAAEESGHGGAGWVSVDDLRVLLAEGDSHDGHASQLNGLLADCPGCTSLRPHRPRSRAMSERCPAHWFVRAGWRRRGTWLPRRNWRCLNCDFETRTYDAVDRMATRPIHPNMSVAVPGFNAEEQSNE
jgi:hypothetical protein